MVEISEDNPGSGKAVVAQADVPVGSDAGMTEAEAAKETADGPEHDDSAPEVRVTEESEEASDTTNGGENAEAQASSADAEEPAAPAAMAPAAIDVEFFGLTDVGQIREHNEDNFIIGDLDIEERWAGESGVATSMPIGVRGLLFAVCDGMGGAAAGEVASQMAADIVYDRMRSAKSLLARNQSGALGVLEAAANSTADGSAAESSGNGSEKPYSDRDALAFDIVGALERSGSDILKEANSNRARRGMGTTATVAALVDDHLLLGQVGDSRGYILRQGHLVQVTRDQSLVNQLIEAGQLTEEEAETFEHSNIILQALGTAEVVQVDLTYVRLRRGDVLMMCSDGLSGMLRKAELEDTLGQVTDPAEACRVLIREANNAGGHDNITVICARFDGDDLEPADQASVESLAYTKYELPRTFGVGAGVDNDLDGDGSDGPVIELIGDPILVELGPNWAEDLLSGNVLRRREKTSDGMFYAVMFLFTVALALYFWQQLNG